MSLAEAHEETKGLSGTSDLAPTQEQHKRINAWSGPGPAAFDFRSDVVTTPTPSMLKAISNTSLLDDVFMEDPTTNDLESYMAERTEQEAGLFVLSGTMGNQLALRSHLTQPPHSVLCDYRAHILVWEAGGVATLSGALVNGVVPKNGVYLTLEDIKENVVLGDDVHAAPTRVISLENTLGGTIMPLEEVRKISAFAKEHDIKLHLDGARIWEAVVAGAGSLPDYCKEFDSVSLCFSKGLGAPVGSVLVGSKKLIKQARWVRKSIGGGLRQPGVVTAAARVAVDETFGKSPNGEDGILKKSHGTAKRIAEIWTRLGGKLAQPTETNMVWFDLRDANCSGNGFVEIGKQHGLRLLAGGRLVVHYQISNEAVQKLELALKDIVAKKGQNGHTDIAAKVGEKAYR
ncbi:PLP-dependent transferase [Glarea lozoyensis ATCC 20868]|uniref:PLP-dependent transferase n=1 Tax=Glarea lozoyensis (strain ATCC 20868 / MF5171) TaxID=1116229 RepID=S3D0W3_GLAL2|nr:PLP-dependent transferase [Glarea lozoyensis ATCC 20868]EPE31495.1 PLP-dependent transferase [Glarea lozoyensis ATCC 20868]